MSEKFFGIVNNFNDIQAYLSKYNTLYLRSRWRSTQKDCKTNARIILFQLLCSSLRLTFIRERIFLASRERERERERETSPYDRQLTFYRLITPSSGLPLAVRPLPVFSSWLSLLVPLSFAIMYASDKKYEKKRHLTTLAGIDLFRFLEIRNVQSTMDPWIPIEFAICPKTTNDFRVKFVQ